MSKLYKIRKLTTNNSTGDAFGITIPIQIIEPYKETSFNIINGGSEILILEAQTIDNINAIFKKMSIELPSEYYPQLKYHQIQIREQIHNTLNPFRNAIILTSGCNK